MSTSSPNLASAVEALIGASRVLSDRAQRAIYAVDDMVPSVVAKPSSAEEAAEGIVRLLKDEKLRGEMGQKARETVREKFLLTRYLEQYLDFFGAFD